MQEEPLIQAEVWNVARTEKGTAVLVRPVGSDRAVPIFIGPLEAHAILIGLSDVHMPRPLTHDLLVEMAEGLHAQFERVEITGMNEGTFFARVVVRHGLKKFFMDSRPSDALGIATRVKCPVFIAETIIKEASIPLSMMEEQSSVEAREYSEGMDATGSMDLEGDLADESGDEPEKKPTLETPKDVQRSVLKMRLEQAVLEEDYEEAARLRDIINSL